MKKNITNDVYNYWNSRCSGKFPGSNDFNLKKLEVETFCRELQDIEFSSILDVGCGAGETLNDIQSSFPGTLYAGIDIAENMIELAKERYGNNRFRFKVDSLPNMSTVEEKFDVVISERSLINLESVEEQLSSIKRISDFLRPGGIYLMIENFNSGLNNINEVRKNMRLNEISPPWFNLYFEDNFIDQVEMSTCLRVKKESFFASTYYFLSRGIYARIAEDRNETPQYDSEINLVSINYDLPEIGDFCPTKLIVWEKIHG